ncbi:MAG: Trimethylamine-N-oxide reductase (cytochrome c) [Firmicutes bacterium]|nr:Trimethylamine-N-oxide reductase (cytochrome c) [Bacillota bacterium]
MKTMHGYQMTRHVCSRNCYDTCGIIAHVYRGKLEKITGDPEHGYTCGKLCAKGQNAIDYVYSPERIRYPMLQKTRGSGKWERISWEYAMEIICKKILSLKERYHSTLPLCLNKYSGNFGALHYAIEGMFNSLGPTTQTIGTPCFSAGLDAQYLDFGANHTSDLSNMEYASCILLWGVNPAWTAIHAMPYLYRAKEKGAKIIVIDPIYTQTAKKADYYVQVKPGEDQSFALALIKGLIEKNAVDKEFVEQYSIGWENFRASVENLDIDILLQRCGQNSKSIDQLVQSILENHPMHIWCGFGLQRHMHGGKTIRIIDALSALTGNIGVVGGGVNYAQVGRLEFSKKIAQLRDDVRYININRFSQSLREIDNPPIKFLWIACRNLFMQDVAINQLQEEFKKLEFIVSVEKFMTPTMQMSDLVLPVKTEFEELDATFSYWHQWVGINEPAIEAVGEAKSDLEIAQLLAKKLNEYHTNTSSFPINKTAEEFLTEEFTDEIYQCLQIEHWSQLREAPKKMKVESTVWQDRKFLTPSGRFQFCDLLEYRKGLTPNDKYPYFFITPHTQQGINSQYQKENIIEDEPIVQMHPMTAAQENLKNGDLIEIYNKIGSITCRVKISDYIASDMLVCYQSWRMNHESSLNKLNVGIASDLGQMRTGAKGVALYDVLVNFRRV